MKRKISHLAIAAIAAIAPLAITTPAATAAPGGTAVFVGDSIPSNPTPLSYLAGKTGSPIPGTHVNANGCGSDGVMPSAYGQAAGKQTFDFTCAGASIRSGGELVTTQLRHASAAGKLNASTSEVVIMAGANDTYPHILNQVPMNRIETDLTNGLVNTINLAHRLAPNARVKVVGYTQISAPNGDVCVINIGDNTTPVGAIPAVRDSENILQRAGVNASNRAGATFVDSKVISRGHDMCASANQRWIMGVVDTSPQPHNLILHMTNAGLRAVANNAAQK